MLLMYDNVEGYDWNFKKDNFIEIVNVFLKVFFDINLVYVVYGWVLN